MTHQLLQTQLNKYLESVPYQPYLPRIKVCIGSNTIPQVTLQQATDHRDMLHRRTTCTTNKRNKCMVLWCVFWGIMWCCGVFAMYQIRSRNLL